MSLAVQPRQAGDDYQKETRGYTYSRASDRTKKGIEFHTVNCFPIIQKACPEMLDYELVEPMVAYGFVTTTPFVHLNFKAKLKSGADSSESVFFAEVNTLRDQVVCCKIDPYSDTECFEHCSHCEPVYGARSYAGYLYHPKTYKSGPWNGA